MDQMSAEVRMPQVSKEMNECQGLTEQIMKEIELLEGALSPVLRMDGPALVVDQKQGVPDLVPLATTISMNNRTLLQARNLIEALRKRIEL